MVDYFQKQEQTANVVLVRGFSFFGQGQNNAIAFTPLKPWDERKGVENRADTLAGKAMGTFGQIKEAFVFSLSPPAIQELGTASGFTFKLQDRGGNGYPALLAARNQMLGGASQSPLLVGVRPEEQEDSPAAQGRHRPHQGARARPVDRRRQRHAGDQFRQRLRQRLRARRPRAARADAGRRRAIA